MTAQQDVPQGIRHVNRAREVPAHSGVSAEALERVRAMRMARYQAAQTVAMESREDRTTGTSPRTTMKTTGGPSPLTIRRVDEPERTTLYLSGVLDMASILRVRDEAFCVIGARPQALTVDLHLLSRIEFTGVNALVTIGRVARLTKIPFTVCAPASLAEMIRETGLINILTLEEEPVTQTD